MTIAPISSEVNVSASKERAFDLFISRIGAWWPKTMSIGASPPKDFVLEAKPGGRWFERDESSAETEWGRVLSYDRPDRLVLAWQISSQWKYDPELVTEVEVRFIEVTAGETRVTLEHRNLERFGASADQHAGILGGGWPGILQSYAGVVSANG